MLGQADYDERRYEQDSTADPEQTGQHPGEDTENERERDRHFTNNHTAVPTIRAAKSNSIVRP